MYHYQIVESWMSQSRTEYTCNKGRNSLDEQRDKAGAERT